MTQERKIQIKDFTELSHFGLFDRNLGISRDILTIPNEFTLKPPTNDLFFSQPSCFVINRVVRGVIYPPPFCFGFLSAFVKIDTVKTSKSHEIRSVFGSWLIRNQQILGVYPLKTFTSDLLAPQHKKKSK